MPGGGIPSGAVLSERLVAGLERYQTRLRAGDSGVTVHGSLVRTVGLVMEARGIHVAIGERCFIESEVGPVVSAEVVGFDGGRVLLMAEGHADGLAPGARVIPAGRTMEVAAGPNCSAEWSTAAALPIDGNGHIRCAERMPLFGQTVNPMRRALVDEPLDVGVRAINALFRSAAGRGSGSSPAAASGRACCWG